MTAAAPPAIPIEDRIRALPCWDAAPGAIEPLSGGITNRNFLVDVGERRFVVRVGGDIPANHVIRFNEQAASRAAAAIGLSPGVRHTEPDLSVVDFVPSRTLKPEDVPGHLPGILHLMRRTHRELVHAVRGPAMSYWLFHVIRDAVTSLRERGVDVDLDTLASRARELEGALGPVQLCYCHNDWLAANVLDDGQRLWLIDWDYAGFNTPLADLGSLASNNQLAVGQERWLLEHYDEAPIDAQRWRAYRAMKAASLLKETVWSMNAEAFSTIDFDYGAYSAMNLARFERAFDEFRET